LTSFIDVSVSDKSPVHVCPRPTARLRRQQGSSGQAPGPVPVRNRWRRSMAGSICRAAISRNASTVGFSSPGSAPFQRPCAPRAARMTSSKRFGTTCSQSLVVMRAMGSSYAADLPCGEVFRDRSTCVRSSGSSISRADLTSSYRDGLPAAGDSSASTSSSHSSQAQRRRISRLSSVERLGS
jgi:hypothetical protein